MMFCWLDVLLLRNAQMPFVAHTRRQYACDALVQLGSPPDKLSAADLACEEEAVRNPLVTARHGRSATGRPARASASRAAEASYLNTESAPGTRRSMWPRLTTSSTR